MPRHTIHDDSQSPDSGSYSSRTSTRAKNDQKWDAQKNEIYHFYIEEDNTLEKTIQMIEATSGFKARSVCALFLVKFTAASLLTKIRYRAVLENGK